MSNSAGAIGYRHPGDIEIRTISLIAKGQVWDIEKMVTEFSIFQDIFNHYLECSVVIDDAMNFLMRSSGGTTPGWTGDEVLIVSYRNAGVDGFGDETEWNTHYFSLYEMVDRQKIKEGREIYVLNGISLEAYFAMPWTISRAYGKDGAKTISKYAESLFNEYIHTKEAKGRYDEVRNALNFTVEKNNFFQDTIGLQKLIIPNLSVDDTMDFFCTEADSNDHIPYFVFFEDTEGFKFVNLGFLTDYDPIEEYIYSPQNTAPPGSKTGGDDPKTGDNFKILSYSVLKQSSIFDNIEGGMIQNETLNLDLQRKSTATKQFFYQDSHVNFKKLMNTQISGGAPRLSTPYITMTTTRDGHGGSSVFAKENHYPKKLNVFGNESLSYKQSIFNSMIEVVIPANSEIKVGDTIELTFPTTQEFEEDKLKDAKDKYLSGKYLITKLRFKMQGGKSGDDAVCVLECSRDGAMA